MTKGSVITIYKYLMGVNSSEEEELFSVVKGLLWPRAIRLNWTKQSINWIPFVIPSRLWGQLPRDVVEAVMSGSAKTSQGAEQYLRYWPGNAVPWAACPFSPPCPQPCHPASTWAHNQLNKEGRRVSGWFNPCPHLICPLHLVMWYVTLNNKFSYCWQWLWSREH